MAGALPEAPGPLAHRASRCEQRGLVGGEKNSARAFARQFKGRAPPAMAFPTAAGGTGRRHAAFPTVRLGPPFAAGAPRLAARPRLRFSCSKVAPHSPVSFQD